MELVKKTAALFLFTLFLLTSLIFPVISLAGTITSLSYSQSGNTVGTFVPASNTTFVIFTPITAVTLGSTITLTFPAGTTLTSANIAATDFTIVQATQGLCLVGGTDTVPTAISTNETNRTITLTIASSSLSLTAGLLGCGLGQVTIKTTALLGGNEIRHPTSATTTGVLQVSTSVGDSGSISNVTFVADTASSLTKNSGDAQTGNINTTLASNLVILLTDTYGNPVSGSTVTFSISSVPNGATGQSLSTINTTTNSSGQGSTALSLGNTAGSYSVLSSVSGAGNVTFTETATGSSPTPTPTPTPSPTPASAISTLSGVTFSIPQAPPCISTSPKNAPYITKSEVSSLNSVVLYFEPASDPVSHYVLEYGILPSSYIYASSNIGNKNTTNFKVSNLSPNTKYHFRIRADNGCASGNWSNEVEVKTQMLLTSGSENSKIPDQIKKYKLRLKIKTTEEEKVSNIKVTIYSSPKTAYTDENGEVYFENLEPGAHLIVIESSIGKHMETINLTSDSENVDMDIKIAQGLPTIKLIIIAVLTSLIILTILTVIFKKRIIYRKINKLWKQQH